MRAGASDSGTDVVNRSDLLLYGSVGFPLAVIGYPLAIFLPLFYSDEPGISVGLVGLMLFVVTAGTSFRNSLSVFFMTHVIEVPEHVGKLFLLYFGVAILAGWMDRLGLLADRGTPVPTSQAGPRIVRVNSTRPGDRMISLPCVPGI